MIALRRLAALAASAAAVALSGCVAVAVPIAAGAAVFGSTSKDDGNAPAQAVESAAVQGTAQAEGTSQAVDSSLAREFDETVSKGGTAASGRAIVGPAFLRGEAPAPVRDRSYDPFRNYVIRLLDTPAGPSGHRSALLASPDLRTPEREFCGRKPAGVIVDLDPGRDTFDPLAPAISNASLARAIADLRQRDVTVFWTSRLGEGFGERLRETLAEIGLDPRGEDRILLAQTLDQRKQTLREDAARTHCILAILGDERADFDELFLYLKQPDAAIRLDAMIGAGWFLGEPLTTFETGDR